MLYIDKITYKYGDTKALNSFSLKLLEPGLVGLFGHNGAGKTTLFNILSAIKPCNLGQLSFFGEPALDKKFFIANKFRSRIGILMQGTSSDAQLSLYDNLAFFAELMGIKKDEKLARIQSILELARLTHKAQSPLKSFSHGMRRRFELYRSFMHNPKMLFLDEPTAGLDIEEVERFFDFVRAYQQKNQALILFSTHNPAELERCDQVVMIKDGAVIAQDSAEFFKEDLNYWHYEVELDHCGEPKALSFRRADFAESYQKICEAQHV